MGHWVTIDGNHVYINDGPINDNGNRYVDMMATQTNAKQILATFKEETGVECSLKVWQTIPHEHLGNILDTVAAIKKENPDINLHEIHCYNENEWDIDALKNPDTGEADKDVWAAYSYNYSSLVLNNIKYKNSKEALDAEYKHDTEIGWNPKGDSDTVIRHELGHATTYKVVDDLYDKLGVSVEEWRDCVVDWMHEQSIRTKGYEDNKLVSEVSRRFVQAEKELKQLGYKGSFTEMVGKTYLCNTDGFYLEESKFKTENKNGVGDYATTNLHECLAEVFADVKTNGTKASEVSRVIYKQFFGGIK